MERKYKFEDLPNYLDFDFIEIFRDKKKKRTFWKLKCKTCGCEVIKEEYNLFNKHKKIRCFSCEKRKSIEIISEDLVVSILNEFGSKLISIEKNGFSINRITFKCICGNIDTKIFKHDIKWKCIECTYSERKWPSQKNVKDFINEIKKQGCLPLFEETDYKNVNTSLPIKCTCGNSFTARYSNVLEHGKIRCRRCKSEEISGEKHWNWKGGGTGRRFEGENHWERKIKRKFNFTCCITGNKNVKELVAHHLDAYSSNEDKRLDINNGVCISKDLHKEFHSKYDKYKGTCNRKDFLEFFKEKTGINFQDYLIKNNIIFE